MQCAICSSANVVLITDTREFTGPAGKSAMIEIEMYKCNENDCGEEFLDSTQAKAVSQKFREAGLLSPQ